MKDQWVRVVLTARVAGLSGEFDVKLDSEGKVAEGLRYFGYFESKRVGEPWFSPAVIWPNGDLDWGNGYSKTHCDLHGATIKGFPVTAMIEGKKETLDTDIQPTR
jgi:hypothetical protein